MKVIINFDNRLGIKEEAIIGQEDKLGLDPITVDGIAVDSFEDAFKRVQDGSTIVINKNTVMSNYIQTYRNDNVTIQLNNASLTCNQPIYCWNKTLNITGEGTIKASDMDNGDVFIMSNIYDSWNPILNIDGKIRVIGNTCIFTNGKTKNNTINIGKDVVLDGFWYGFASNGTSTGTKLNFNGTAITRAEAADEPNGIYLAGDGEYFLGGNSKVESFLPVEIRAGKLTIEGGEYVSTGEGEATQKKNGNGSTGQNICISVAEHSTKLPIEVKILGGKFKANGAAFMEGDPNATGVATENTTIGIYGGIFSAKEAVKTLTPDSDCKNFIYGGKFSNLENEDYIAKGYKAEVAYNGTVEVVAE
jgi:hypothetical protein